MTWTTRGRGVGTAAEAMGGAGAPQVELLAFERLRLDGDAAAAAAPGSQGAREPGGTRSESACGRRPRRSGPRPVPRRLLLRWALAEVPLKSPLAPAPGGAMIVRTMNPFCQLLRARGSKPPVGTWIVSASPLVAEAVGHSGFDWGVLDMEHSPLDLMALVHLLQAVGNTKMVPVVRLPWNDAVMVKRVLDAGAHTALFPFIQNADEAARAVAATRYPPEGVRGLSSMGRASRFGSMPDYHRTANRSVGVVVQLETPQAVARLEEIAAVPGVDALFVAPGDLSAAMGHAGQLTHPAVMALITDAAQRARAIGKPIGSVGTTPEVVIRYRAAGYDFLAVASDLALLMRGAAAAAQALREGDSASHVHTLVGGTQTSGP